MKRNNYYGRKRQGSRRMRKDRKEETMKVRRERCQFNKNLIKGNGEIEAQEDKNLVRLLVQKTEQRTCSREQTGGEIA